MQTDAPVPKGIATKQTMKIWFQRGGNMLSPTMEVLGDKWHFSVKQDIGLNLQVSIHRACILKTLPSSVTYDIRFMAMNNDYISLHGDISEQTGADYFVVPSLTVVSFPGPQKYFNAEGKMMIELNLYVKEQAEKFGREKNLCRQEGIFCAQIFCFDAYFAFQFLSMHSPHFKSMFQSGFKEKEQVEIELKDLDFNEFIELLSVVYPVGEYISVSNVECLLKLADRFEMLDILMRCEHFLLLESNMENFKKLLLAQRYRLVSLQKSCASQYQQLEEIKKLKGEADYHLLDETTKSALFDSLARAISK